MRWRAGAPPMPASANCWGDLAEEERHHAQTAERITQTKLTEGDRRNGSELFLLQVIQPGLAGLMDGSVSTLAPLFAAAFATHRQPGCFPGRPGRQALGPASAWDCRSPFG